jgi:hypothetical protein
LLLNLIKILSNTDSTLSSSVSNHTISICSFASWVHYRQILSFYYGQKYFAWHYFYFVLEC